MGPLFYKEWLQGLFEGIEQLDMSSRQSIIYITTNIWKDSNFSVQNQGTILFGKNECCFIITFE